MWNFRIPESNRKQKNLFIPTVGTTDFLPNDFWVEVRSTALDEGILLQVWLVNMSQFNTQLICRHELMAFHSQNAYKNHVQHIPRLWVCHPGVICRSWPSKKRRQRGDMCYDDRLWGEAGLTKYWEYYIQHNSSFNTICVYTLRLHFIWFFASICLLCLPMFFLKSGSTSTSVQDLANVGLGGA